MRPSRHLVWGMTLGASLLVAVAIPSTTPRTDFEAAVHERFGDELDHPHYPPDSTPCEFPTDSSGGTESEKAGEWNEACFCQFLVDVGASHGDLPPGNTQEEWDDRMRDILACTSQNPFSCPDCGWDGGDDGGGGDPPDPGPPTGPPFDDERWNKPPKDLTPTEVIYLMDYFFVVVTDKVQEVREDESIQGDGEEQREIAKRIYDEMRRAGLSSSISRSFSKAYSEWTYA